MRVGLHLAIAGGLLRAVETARQLGCDTLQLFSSNPRSWRTGPITTNEGEAFREATRRAGLWPVVLHTPYLLNLASPRADLYENSVAALRAAFQRALTLGATYVVTHVGSHRDSDADEGRRRVVEAIARALEGLPPQAMLLLENSVGAGDQLAATVDDMASLVRALATAPVPIGMCLDMAHLWGAGYDLSTPQGAAANLELFMAAAGADSLRLIHANDSACPLASRRDRHALPGSGSIGQSAFAALRATPHLAAVPLIVEAPEERPAVLQQVLAFLRGEGPPPAGGGEQAGARTGRTAPGKAS